jgi:hypothetical protein
MNNTIPLRIVRAVISAVPALRPHLSAQALKIADGYTGIRAEMSGEIHDAVYDYLTGSGNVTAYRSAMALAVSAAYIAAADAAYVEGGGSLPLDDDTAAWARGQLDAQLGFVDGLFESLRELRKEGDVNPAAEALGRANGYAGGLDGFYNEATLRGSKNKMVTWHLGATEKHCKTCASLSGQSHKISWFVDRDYIPRKPGASMECNGYNCDCTLTDRDGNELTI